MKVYEIIPEQLYQSAKTHDLTIVERTNLVETYKLSTVVNLWHTYDDAMAALTKTYIHFYFPDGKNVPWDELNKMARNLTRRIQAGESVLVHCWGGRNRSGLLNAMILMKLYGYDGNTAYEYIRIMRPKSLVNETFANWLKER